MNNVVERLNKVMSYSEIQVVKEVIKELGGDVEKPVVNSKLADSVGITKSVLVNALKILEVAGVLETRSMGMKGTYIKVLNQDVLQAVANF